MKYFEKLKIVRDTIEVIGDNSKREGLVETPKRVVKSWEELYAGYNIDISGIFKTFTDGTCDEMVVLKDISFFSMCEHHMLPFYGTVAIGYLPKGKVIGVSKLARLTEAFARRLQVQERLTSEIADAIVEYLNPKGVMVVCEAKHLCMIARGVKKPNSTMITSAMRGAFKDIVVRNEFMSLVT